MNKYKLLHDSMQELKREASEKGGSNLRAQMILDLIEDCEVMQAQVAQLESALERLVFAAHCRENSTGDQIRLIETREELSTAAKNAEELLVAFCKLHEGSK